MVRKQWYVGLVTEHPQKTEGDEVAFTGPGDWQLRMKRVSNWMFEPWTCTWGPFSTREAAFFEAQRILARWGYAEAKKYAFGSAVISAHHVAEAGGAS